MNSQYIPTNTRIENKQSFKKGRKHDLLIVDKQEFHKLILQTKKTCKNLRCVSKLSHLLSFVVAFGDYNLLKGIIVPFTTKSYTKYQQDIHVPNVHPQRQSRPQQPPGRSVL